MRPDGAATPGSHPAVPAQAAAAFERFKTLEGKWSGKSTKGWEETSTLTLIAAGSALLHSSFDAHPGEQMLTVIHPDGGRLMLTHYCVAKNQPRLVLTRADSETGEYLFEFLDATNLASRDRGHMDKVLFRLGGADSYTTRWTWYQDGKENWMEEIVNTRVK